MFRSAVWILACLFAFPGIGGAQSVSAGLWAEANACQDKDSLSLLFGRAMEQAGAEGRRSRLDSIRFDLGRRFVALGMLDSARHVARRAIRQRDAGIPNALLAGFYNMLAITYHHQQSLDSAQTYYLKAVDLLERQGDTLRAASIRFNIGNLYLQLRDWPQADAMFRHLLEAIDQTKDSTYLAGVYAALSSTAFEMGRLDVSSQYANRGLDIARRRHDPLGEMLSLRQLGNLSLQAGQPEIALTYFRQTADGSEKLGVPYYKALAQLGLAEAYAALHQYPQAIAAAQQSLDHAEDPGYMTQLPTVYQLLSDAHRKLGRYEEALSYLTLSNAYRQKQISQDNKRVVNELMVQYETARKDRQLAEQQLMIEVAAGQTRLYLILALGAAMTVIFLSVLYLFRQKLHRVRLEKLQHEHEMQLLQAVFKGEEKERQRIATELHDSVSNALFACKLSLSAQVEKARLDPAALAQSVSVIDRVQTTIRSIAHKLIPVELEGTDLFKAMDNYVRELDRLTPDTEIVCQQFGSLRPGLRSSVKLVLFRALQELIGNALKHAAATSIDVNLYAEEKTLWVVVEDNGVGFTPTEQHWGWGLQSLQKQLMLIGADLDVVSDAERGTHVSIEAVIA